RQLVEDQEQRDGQILSQFRAPVGRERCRVNNRLRQPRADVLLAPGASRRQHVETNPRRRGHEKCPRVRHSVAVGRMPAQVCLLPRALGPSHGPEQGVGEPEQAPPVRLEARGRIRHCARGAHVIRPGSKAVRRQRARASPPRARAISPSTNAAAPPTTPLPLPGPPVATAKTSPPLTTAIGPSTKATIAPRRPWFPIRWAARYRAIPPMTTPTSASTTTAVAQSRREVRP